LAPSLEQSRKTCRRLERDALGAQARHLTERKVKRRELARHATGEIQTVALDDVATALDVNTRAHVITRAHTL
jgi:hypothetical protein